MSDAPQGTKTVVGDREVASRLGIFDLGNLSKNEMISGVSIKQLG